MIYLRNLYEAERNIKHYRTSKSQKGSIKIKHYRTSQSQKRNKKINDLQKILKNQNKIEIISQN